MYPETVSGLEINYYQKPFKDYPCFLALIVAEKNGEYFVPVDEMFDRCKELGFSGTKGEISDDIARLIQDGRLVEEYGQLYRASTWDKLDDLAECLANRLSNNRIGYPQFFTPYELSDAKFGDHPLYEDLRRVLQTHLGMSLSIAVCSSIQESKLLISAIDNLYKQIVWTPYVSYRKYVATSCEQEVASVEARFGCKAYWLQDLLDPHTAPDLGLHLSRAPSVKVSRATTIVPIDGSATLSVGDLHQLLMCKDFGGSVILLTEESFFNSDAGKFLRGLSQVGVPVEYLGCTGMQHTESLDLHVFSQLEKLKNQQLFKLDICAG